MLHDRTCNSCEYCKYSSSVRHNTYCVNYFRFFSIVSYGSNWLFVASFFISAFIAMLFAKPLSYFSEAYERDKGKERTPLLDGSSQGGMQEVDF